MKTTKKQRRKAKKKNIVTTERVREVVYGMFEVASDESGDMGTQRRVDLQKLLGYEYAEVNGVVWHIAWRRSPDNSALVMLTSTYAAPGRMGAATITINNGELAVETKVFKGCFLRLLNGVGAKPIAKIKQEV